jgi:hypothetical protein
MFGMPASISPEEAQDIQTLGERISNKNLVEGLETLLSREKILLEQSDMGDGEAREITLHNIMILAAAAVKIESLTSKPEPEV